MGKLTNQVSPTLSWPLASRHPRGSLSGSSHNRLKKRLKLEARRRFMFDSMCGIPGPSSSMDYQLLRAWQDPEVECGRSSSNPFIILDEYDVSANLDKCCNNSWGRTARTFVWQTSLHGLKYLVYCRKHLLERFGWAIVCLLAASLSLYLAIMAAKHFYEDPTRIHLKKIGLQDHELDFPEIQVCSHALNSLSNLTKAEKDRIEILLSPMKTLPRLWEVWTELVKNTTEQRASAFILLENEGHDENIKELLQQIVIEAALLLAPKCGSWLLDEQDIQCDHVSFNNDGEICYKVSLQENNNSVISYGLDGQQKNLGYFINKASKDLQLSIQPQLAGFPTINSSIWNPLQLCTSSWLSSSHNADVMCRSMSHFGGGMRFYPEEISPSLNVEVGNLLGQKLQCEGHEKHFLDCQSNYKDISGHNLMKCDFQEPKAGLLCNPPRLVKDGRFSSIEGIPLVSMDLEKEKMSYFCEDNISVFGETEARVFCKMLGWPMGKKVATLGLRQKDMVGNSQIFSTVSCHGDELHILDCENNIIFKCEKVVEVMCGPGFPLTLRLENPIQESFSTSSSFGHPVVDTTDAVGYICDKHISPHVPQIMCKMFGYPYGRRLNNVTFTSNNSKVYVFDQLDCQGDEESVFECRLGPWLLEVASNCHQTLTIACSESPSGLNLSPLLLTRKPAEQDQMFGDSTKSGQGLVALQTGQTLTYTPFCKSKQQRAPAVDAATDSIGYEDQKANGLCKSLDFSCGMESRNHKLNISSTFDNLGSGLKRGVFVHFNCLDSTCDHFEFELTTSCGGGGSAELPWVIECLSKSDPNFEICSLLHHDHSKRIDQMSLNLQFTSHPQLDLFIGTKKIEVDQSTMAGNSLDIKVSGHVIETTIPKQTADYCYSTTSQSEPPRNTKEDWIQCQAECRANFQFQLCGCLPWFQSRTLPLPRRHFESKAQEESSSAWSSKICIGQSRNLCHDSLHEASKIAPHNFSLALSLAKKQGHSMLMPPGASTSSEAAAEFDKAKSLCENCLHMKTPCHGLIDYNIDNVNIKQIDGPQLVETLLEVVSKQNEDEEYAPDDYLMLQNLLSKLKNHSRSHSTLLKITLDRDSSILYQRRLVMEYELFIGCIGGIMALFTGFSFIFLAEAFYFFTIRWYEEFTKKLQPKPTISSTAEGWMKSHSDPEIKSLRKRRTEELLQNKNNVPKAVVDITNEMAKIGLATTTSENNNKKKTPKRGGNNNISTPKTPKNKSRPVGSAAKKSVRIAAKPPNSAGKTSTSGSGTGGGGGTENNKPSRPKSSKLRK